MADNISATTSTTASLAVGIYGTSAIDFNGDADWWSMYLVFGYGYIIDVKGGSTFNGTLSDPWLAVRNATGTLLSYDDDTGAGLDAWLYFVPTSTGTYYADVEESGNNATGTYAVFLSYDLLASTYTAASVSVGSGGSSRIDFAGDADWVAISLTAHQAYLFDLKGLATTSGTLVNPWLGIANAAGALISFDDNSGIGNNSSLIFTPTSSGTYYLMVYDSTNSSTGSYVLETSLLAAPVLSIGNSITGNLASSTEADYYRVDATGNQLITVSFDAPSGVSGYPFEIQVVDDQGPLLTQWYVGQDFSFTVGAPASGTAYLKVMAGTSHSSQTYGITLTAQSMDYGTTPTSSAKPLTGDGVVDATTHGYFWELNSTRTITWAIANSSSSYWIDPKSALARITEIFTNFESVANINLEGIGYYSSVEAANALGADIVISLDASNQFFTSQYQWARGFFPSTLSTYNPYTGAAGDVWINVNSAANNLSYAPGSAGYFLALHEFGHALGLKHPHDDGGTGHPTFTQATIGSLDKDWATVMSYADDFDWNLRQWDPATLMPLDVIGMQSLYGANLKWCAGDDIYTLSQDNMYRTLWDSGGLDCVSVTTEPEGWFILLPSIQLASSSSVLTGVALAMDEVQLSSPQTLYWLMGDIEKIDGSAYADHLAGNETGNAINANGGNDFLYGFGGNDTLNGGAGNDILDGGLGNDTAVFSGKKVQYVITKTSTGYIVADGVEGRDGTDTLVNIEVLQFTDQTQLLHFTGRASRIDFAGDGKSDLLWRNDSGMVAIWEMNGLTQKASAVVATIPNEWKIVDGAGDYDGDGKSDLLWRNDNGMVAIWEMNGLTQKASAVVATIPNEWKIVDGAGDYDGDGKSDLLWRNDNGMVAIWEMNGLTQKASAVVATIPTEWKIVDGAGDYDGDGKSDLLWRNDNGMVAIWEMDGLTQKAAAVVATIPNEWKIVDGAGDYDGDGKSDLLWRNDNGMVAIWEMNGLTQKASAVVATIPNEWKIVDGAGDYDGDGKSDLLWRNDNGMVAIWEMNGLTQKAAAVVATIPNEWKIQGGVIQSIQGDVIQSTNTRRDYDGDGKSDLLWRNDNGMVAIWEMNGLTQKASAVVATIPNEWKIVDGAGDYDGDGKSDLLWRNDNGMVAIWEMNGLTQKASAVVATIPNEWKIVDGAGDYDGDGKSDLLWRNDNGMVAIWEMNGLTQKASAVVATIPTEWKIVDGAGDYDGDGKSDLLWRNDNGMVAIWEMDGLTQKAAAVVATIPNEWKIVDGAGDYDGDGKSDLLWRNDNGMVAIWEMNGLTQKASAVVATIPNEWKIVDGAGDYDGDGKSDLLWRNDNGMMAIWEMDGLTQKASAVVATIPNEWYLIP